MDITWTFPKGMEKEIRRVLQEAKEYGIAQKEFIYCVDCGLNWFQRLVNWFCLLLRTSQPPFIDPQNHATISFRWLNYAERAAVDHCLEQYVSRCWQCGGQNLGVDHGGYYYDTETWSGAPLVCQDCNK